MDTKPFEIDLIARIATGDEEAFEQFYDLFSPCLFSVAVKILRNETAAEEVLQDVFLQVWNRASTYQPNLGKPLTWAITMVRNRAIDRIRANRRGQNLVEAITREQVTQPDHFKASDESLIGRETTQKIRAELAQLPDPQRKSIEMAFFSGLSQSEISTAMETPLGTVKSHIRRGMLQLRDALDSSH